MPKTIKITDASGVKLPATAADLLDLRQGLGAAAVDHSHTAADVGAAPENHSHTAADVGAAPENHSHTAADVGAAPENHSHTVAQISDAGAAGRTLLQMATLAEIQSSVSGAYMPNGALYFGPEFVAGTPLSQKIVKSATLPDPNNTNRATFEFMHDGPSSYIYHLTQGPNMGASAALIGLGIDAGGVGLFVNNKVTGKGIVITQNPTITSASAYGMLVNGGAGAAPAVWMQQNNDAGSLNAQTLLVLFAYQSFSATSQKLMEWRKPNGGSDGTLAGYIRSSDGALVQQAPLILSGADLTLQSSAGVGGGIYGEIEQIKGAGAYIELWNTSQTSGQRRVKHLISANYYVMSGRDEVGASTGDLLMLQMGSQNVGIAGQTAFGNGTKCFGLPNVGTTPNAAVASGVALYFRAGQLRAMDSTGIEKTIQWL
jgi:hypothetical protein